MAAYESNPNQDFVTVHKEICDESHIYAKIPEGKTSFEG